MTHDEPSRVDAPAEERTQRVAAVVLAAGSATRFGATKQVAEIDGQPLVAHVVAIAHGATVVDEVLVVVGHDADTVAVAAERGGPVEIVHNADHAAGQSTSLRAGIAAASGRGADVAVILLADEPGVASAVVEQVVAAVLAGEPAARAHYEDAPGHPVAFARVCFDRLRRVDGDRGARDLLADLAVRDVAVAGRRPRDVDSPDDLDAARHG
jgi:molybdenum cofactor cytidylyltransferase